MKYHLLPKVFKIVLSFLITACGPLPTPFLATETHTITPSPSLTPTPTESNPFLELTAIGTETQRAEQINIARTQLAQTADSAATHEYLIVLQTVQAQMEATRIYEQAQQQIATEQAKNAEATAQSIIAVQQTATAIADQQIRQQISSLVDRLPEFPILLSDSFDNNENGWAPGRYNGYDVSIEDSALQVNLSEEKFSPLHWTCDHCSNYDRFSYQIDIKTPKGVRGVVAGIFFGSPTRIDQPPFEVVYGLSLYSTGAIILQRISRLGIDTVQLWDKRQDLLTPDGNFHTLQVIVYDKYAMVFVDRKAVGDAFQLEYPSSGYIGMVVTSTDVNVSYDNMKVVALP